MGGSGSLGEQAQYYWSRREQGRTDGKKLVLEQFDNSTNDRRSGFRVMSLFMKGRSKLCLGNSFKILNIFRNKTEGTKSNLSWLAVDVKNTWFRFILASV